MKYNVIPRDLRRLPLISFPHFMEGIEEVMPTRNMFNGLSVYEDDKNVYVETAVPGIDPKEVEVTFDEGVLTVRGEKKEEEKGKRYIRHGMRSVFYQVVPGHVDEKAMPTANYKNGVMTVAFVKELKTKPRRISVKTA